MITLLSYILRTSKSELYDLQIKLYLGLIVAVAKLVLQSTLILARGADASTFNLPPMPLNLSPVCLNTRLITGSLILDYLPEMSAL